MSVNLYDHQIEALGKMHNGCILCGGVGTGKSRTSLAYFFTQNGGKLTDGYEPMNDSTVKDLYIITTARKRDTFEWEDELIPFLMSTDPAKNLYHNKIVVDSWNNIGKYVGIKDAFFIFDEQRVIGSGAWVKSFLKIAACNKWILLSATPGDTWTDYIPVFIANGFYKNRSEFVREHVVYNRFSKFPKVDRYVGTKKLNWCRERVLVNMPFERETCAHHADICVGYDLDAYKKVIRDRWDPFKKEPIVNAAGLCYVLRKAVNSDKKRLDAVRSILEKHPKCIIFYNFNYELDLLKEMLNDADWNIAEWNGHKHEPIPDMENWCYLVQYTAGCEGWNCITTDTMIFYSQNYSYKVMEQASGRIDRLNTPFKDLYYYHLKSRATIDIGIERALKAKKKFNEERFAGMFEKKKEK